ncbi:MAG TPA: ABC transporter permease subunit [Polyangia bacterium]|jgi:ABC-2 type transport system permease protein
MSAAATVAKREIKTYFNSPVAYIVVMVFMLISGYLFFSQLFLEKQAELRYYFTLTPLIFTFIIPAITMRLIAEEKGSGTLEMLVTMPVREWEIVLGKFLAGMAMLAAIVGMTCLYAVTVTLLGPVDRGPIITGYLGLLLMGGAYVSIGVMASSLTRNQIVAFILAFAISFALFIFGQVVQYAPEWIGPVLSFLSMGNHFESLSRGVIDSRDVLYYVSVMMVSLIIATASLESRKWK